LWSWVLVACRAVPIADADVLIAEEAVFKAVRAVLVASGSVL
jgi:hypothetical protein